MSKSTLSKRIKAYEKMVAGSTGIRKSGGVDTRAFHKPGSNKK